VSKTAVVFSPIFYKHNPGKGHPDSATRLMAIVQEIQKMKTQSNASLQFVQPEKASIEDLEMVHAIEYIRLVKAVCAAGGGLLDLQDTSTSPDSFEVARYAVGGTLKAANLVIKHKFENAFALVRPPGHHAAKFRALGFCIFNNVAIAAQYLIEKLESRRVLILDVDAHHGNGTQEKFYETDKVLYMSLHQDPTDFPGTGFIEEIGKAEGLGYNVNIPLPYGTSDQTYLRAVREIVNPIARQYKPEFMLVSAGFDTHYSDPVGDLSLSASCIREVYEAIVSLASEVCQKRLVCVLEGGYNLKFIGKLAAVAIAKMSKTRMVVNDRVRPAKKSIETRGERVIKEVKKVQRAFWDMY
jgi:acetoin utilization deacetylase AcuC-like enzyme